MLNIDIITNNKSLPINSSSIGDKKSGPVKLTLTTKNKSTELNSQVTKKSIIINYPKTLTEKVSILKSNVNSLKSLKCDEKIVIIKNKNLGEITPKNILKSFFYRKLVTVTPIYDKTSFFYDNRKKSTINNLNQVKFNNNNNNFSEGKPLSFNNTISNSIVNPDSNKGYGYPQISLIKFLTLKGTKNNISPFNTEGNIGENFNGLETSQLNSESLTYNNQHINNKKGIAAIAMDLALKAKLSKSSQKEISTARLGKLRKFTNIISKFNADVANYQSVFYHFKKSNKIVIQPFINASNILKLSFLAMGCLISKPFFKIVYTKNRLTDSDDFKVKARRKVIIQLFYYVKFKPSYLSLRRLIMKFIAKPNIMDPNYNFNSKMVKSDKMKFLSELEAKPQLTHTLMKMKRYENSKIFFAKYAYKFQFLAMYLTKLFGTEVQLDLVRLYRPYSDSNILVQDLNLRSYKNRFYGLTKRLFRVAKIRKSITNLVSGDSNSISPYSINGEVEATPLASSSLTGIHVKLGGRSFQQRIVPRRTVKQIQRGSLSRAKIKYIQKARFTGKVKRGSYSFTVTVGHAF